MGGIARQIRSLIEGEAWDGTVTDLAIALNQAMPETVISPPHLAIWLRRHEPTLWWEHGVRVHFSRTGKCRRVHLSLRDGRPDNSAVTGVSGNSGDDVR